MAAPKAKTHIERMGFVDADIKNPTHDDLIAAFMPNIPWIVSSLHGKPIPGALSDWTTKYQTEVPIADGRFIIGFIDMTVTAQRKLLCGECQSVECAQTGHDRCQDHRYRYDPAISGDMNEQASRTCRNCAAVRAGKCSSHDPKVLKLDRHVNLAIEFKTSKITAGEVLRQMNTYRHYERSTFVLVTCGPCPHKPLIWNEKIAIVEFVNSRWFLNWKSDLYDVYEHDVPE